MPKNTANKRFDNKKSQNKATQSNDDPNATTVANNPINPHTLNPSNIFLLVAGEKLRKSIF